MTQLAGDSRKLSNFSDTRIVGVAEDWNGPWPTCVSKTWYQVTGGLLEMPRFFVERYQTYRFFIVAFHFHRFKRSFLQKKHLHVPGQSLDIGPWPIVGSLTEKAFRHLRESQGPISSFFSQTRDSGLKNQQKCRTLKT